MSKIRNVPEDELRQFNPLYAGCEESTLYILGEYCVYIDRSALESPLYPMFPLDEALETHRYREKAFLESPDWDCLFRPTASMEPVTVFIHYSGVGFTMISTGDSDYTAVWIKIAWQVQ